MGGRRLKRKNVVAHPPPSPPEKKKKPHMADGKFTILVSEKLVGPGAWV
jgi:hypothetical protein